MPLNTPKTFCMKIENIVKEKKITHMDAVLWYCQKAGLEIEGINSLISKALRDNFQGLFNDAGGTAVKDRILTALAAEAASIVPGVNVTGTQLLARESGTILNPNMTLLMNAPSLRSFSFQFKMTPRDDREECRCFTNRN